MPDFTCRIGNLKKKKCYHKKKMLSPDATFLLFGKITLKDRAKKIEGEIFSEIFFSESSLVSFFSFRRRCSSVIWENFHEIWKMQKNAKKSCLRSELCEMCFRFFGCFSQFFWKSGMYLRKFNMIAWRQGCCMVNSVWCIFYRKL